MFQDRTRQSGGSPSAPSAFKTQDESITDSTTLHDDVELTIDLQAGFKYAFECYLAFENTGGLCKVAFSDSTGLSATNFRMGIVENGTPVLSLGETGDLISVGRPSILVGAIEVSASGAFQLQWSQSVATGTTTLKSGSYLIAWRII